MGVPRHVAASPWLSPRLVTFWLANGLSLLGDQMFVVALAWHVLNSTGSAGAMGLVLVGQAIPRLAGLLFGGVVADRLDRRHLIALAAAADAILAGAMGVAMLESAPLWIIVVLAGLFAGAEGFVRPAFLALTPELVGPSHVQRLNGLFQIAKQAALVAGPAAGALFIALIGSSGTIFLDGLSFAFLTLTALWVRTIRPRTRADQTGFGRELLAVFRYVLAEPVLLPLTLIGVLLNFADMGALDIGLPKLTSLTLGAGAAGFGVALSAYGAGMVAGAIVMTAAPRLPRQGLILCVTLVFQGLLFAALGLPTSMTGVIILLVLYGLSTAPIPVILITTLQERSRPELLGRVLSTFEIGGKILIPVSYALTGPLMDDWGVRPVMIAAGLAVVVIALGGLSTPALRRA